METNESTTTGASEEVTANVTATPETTTRVRVPRKEFMQAWEETVAGLKSGKLTGSGVRLVANRLGLKETSVSQRATNYRTKKNVPLSNMPRGGGSTFNEQAAQDELAEIKAGLAPQETEADAEG